MNWSEGMIARAISLQTLARKCVVLVDNCNWTGHECDVLGVTTDLRIIDVEIKISRSDLKADAKKDKWWQWVGEAGHLGSISRYFGNHSKIARTHPPKVWKHYYALPKEIWKPELLDFLPSQDSGVLLLEQGKWDGISIECVRRSKPNKDATRISPEAVMDIARLANIRMWEAYKKEDQAKAEASRLYKESRVVAQ
jgi:hypothetical protein